MTLQQRIDADLKDAMRAKDAVRLGVLRMLKSAMKYGAIEKSGAEGELDDAEAVQVIRKQVKQRQDSIESFEKGGRPELASKEKEELAMLSAYLPPGDERRGTGGRRSRSHRGDGRHLTSANGSRDEIAPGETRRPRGRQKLEPGSATAVGVREIGSNMEPGQLRVRRGGARLLLLRL